MSRHSLPQKSTPLFARSLKYVLGFNAVWLVHVGRRRGLFRSIASHAEPISPKRLANETGLFEPAVRAWCSAAVCVGYLLEKDGKVTMSAEAKEVILNEQSPFYVAGQLTYSALRSLEYDGLDDLFLLGKARPPSSRNTIEAFDAVTSWDHYAALNAIKNRKKKIHKLLLRGCNLLDVGCGTGKFINRASAVYPHSNFVGIDPYADIINKVRNKMLNTRHRRAPNSLVSKGLKDTAKIVQGSGENMHFQEEFDIVYLGESLYLMRNKLQAIKNCYRALRDGGTIAILEGLLPEVIACKTCEENKMIMSMQLDFVLQGHKFMTKKEIAKLLKLSGFKNAVFTHLAASFYLVTAEK